MNLDLSRLNADVAASFHTHLFGFPLRSAVIGAATVLKSRINLR